MTLFCSDPWSQLFSRQEEMGHLLRAGSGTKETFPGDSCAGTYTMWCWGGDGGKILLNVWILTLRSNVINALCHFTNKKEDVFFFFLKPKSSDSQKRHYNHTFEIKSSLRILQALSLWISFWPLHFTYEEMKPKIKLTPEYYIVFKLLCGEPGIQIFVSESEHMFNYMSFFKIIAIINMDLPCAKHCIGHYVYMILFNLLQQPCKERLTPLYR